MMVDRRIKRKKAKLASTSDVIELLPWKVTTSCQVVQDGAARYFEFQFDSPHVLNGSPSAGWFDPLSGVLAEVEYSTDLKVWQKGKFLPAPNPITQLDDRVVYRVRARYRQDSETKTGAIYFEADPSSTDSRSGPLTSIMLGGITLALPRYPYSMPEDAHALQEDMIAEGYTGAVVTAASVNDWIISVPSVDYLDYRDNSRVSWPGFLIEDMNGILNTVMDGMNADAEFVDPEGIKIEHKRAFARLKLTNP